MYSLKETCKKCVAWKNLARNVLTCKNLTMIAVSCKTLTTSMFLDESYKNDTCKKCIFGQLALTLTPKAM